MNSYLSLGEEELGQTINSLQGLETLAGKKAVHCVHSAPCNVPITQDQYSACTPHLNKLEEK